MSWDPFSPKFKISRDRKALIKQLKYKVDDNKNQKRSLEKLPRHIRGKLCLFRGLTMGKVGQRSLFEEAVLDLGHDRWTGFGLAQWMGRAFSSLSQAEPEKPKGPLHAARFGFHSVKEPVKGRFPRGTEQRAHEQKRVNTVGLRQPFL